MGTLNSFHVIKHDDGKEGVYYGTKLIGYVMRFEDGYYSFNFNRKNNGWWSSYNLRDIAGLLDDLNKPWDNQVKEYFDNLPPEEDEWEGVPF